MDVVLPYIDFQDFQKPFLVAEHVYPLSGVLGDLILEYPEPIFRAEHDRVFRFLDSLFVGFARRPDRCLLPRLALRSSLGSRQVPSGKCETV